MKSLDHSAGADPFRSLELLGPAMEVPMVSMGDRVKGLCGISIISRCPEMMKKTRVERRFVLFVMSHKTVLKILKSFTYSGSLGGCPRNRADIGALLSNPAHYRSIKHSACLLTSIRRCLEGQVIQCILG